MKTPWRSTSCRCDRVLRKWNAAALFLRRGNTEFIAAVARCRRENRGGRTPGEILISRAVQRASETPVNFVTTQ